MLKGKASKFDVEIEDNDDTTMTVKDAFVAWSPFILVLLFLLLTSTLVPAIHDPLSAIKSNVPIYSGEGASPYTFKIMGYSGMTQSIADFIVRVTGSFYPLVAPLIGSIGTFVTGSSTSSSVLFSKLQASTGAELNINQIWLVAANTVGSTAGKIISPQSIAVATAATATVGKESEILTKVIKYFVLFVIIYGLVCYFGVKLI